MPVRLRKIRRLSWGWVGAGGGSHVLNAAIFQELAGAQVSSPTDIDMIADSVIDSSAARFRAEFKNAPPKDRVGLLAVFNNGSRFVLHQYTRGFSWGDSQVAADFAVGLPAEATPEFTAEISMRASRDLFVPQNREGTHELIRRVAAVVLHIHAHLESVGPIIDLALSTRTGPAQVVEFVLHGNVRDISNASDAQLQRMLVPAGA